MRRESRIRDKQLMKNNAHILLPALLSLICGAVGVGWSLVFYLVFMTADTSVLPSYRAFGVLSFGYIFIAPAFCFLAVVLGIISLILCRKRQGRGRTTGLAFSVSGIVAGGLHLIFLGSMFLLFRNLSV